MAEWVRASTKWHAVKVEVSPTTITSFCGLSLSKADDTTPTETAPRCLKCRKATP